MGHNYLVGHLTELPCEFSSTVISLICSRPLVCIYPFKVLNYISIYTVTRMEDKLRERISSKSISSGVHINVFPVSFQNKYNPKNIGMLMSDSIRILPHKHETDLHADRNSEALNLPQKTWKPLIRMKIIHQTTPHIESHG